METSVHENSKMMTENNMISVIKVSGKCYYCHFY